MIRFGRPFQFLYWLIMAIFIFLFIFLLVKLFPFYGAAISFVWKLLLPFLIAALIAYLLYPVINKLHNQNMHKGFTILLIYFLFFSSVTYSIYRVYPMLIYQVRDLNDQLPHVLVMYEDFVYNLYISTSFLPEVVHDKMDQLISGIEASLETILERLVGGFTKIIDIIIIITVIPVLVFYYLKDYDQIKIYFKRYVPKKYHVKTSRLIHAIDKSLGNYIRGQLLVGLFVSLATMIVFYLLGVKYALLLAIIMGLTNIIPYFGPIIGAIPAVAITLTISTRLTVFVLIAIFVIQLIENNFLSPYIVGKSINIHPVAIIFALLLGGQLGGILGMIFAVPALTILKAVITQLVAFKRYN